MKRPAPPQQVVSISALHALLKLPKPLHPLVSVLNLAELGTWTEYVEQALAYQFYCITLRHSGEDSGKYGQQPYDFDAGVMTFVAPRQVVGAPAACAARVTGYALIVHPDFLRPYPLASRLKTFGFFSYGPQEALHLSGQEEQVVGDVIQHIHREIALPIDAFSQDVLVSCIEVLLNYANRFYHRQFITRKLAHHELLGRLDNLLTACFDGSPPGSTGPPSVQALAAQLHLSPDYLSDLLRAHTGLSAKQHIQQRLLEKAKEMLATTTHSVSEIAYQLGFEYPQSFSKLFKSKTSVSPLEYRQSVN